MTTEPRTAIAEVRHVLAWVWPHVHVVYPRDCYRPVIETKEQRKGRRMLQSVLAYLETQSAIAHGETVRVFYKGHDLSQER